MGMLKNWLKKQKNFNKKNQIVYEKYSNEEKEEFIQNIKLDVDE